MGMTVMMQIASDIYTRKIATVSGPSDAYLRDEALESLRAALILCHIWDSLTEYAEEEENNKIYLEIKAKLQKVARDGIEEKICGKEKVEDDNNR